ncbi:hypothetical protein J4558_15425 [Leptolyngbya sp. 15MV]|nr:hypothetical protein J4558_15425 [Leptolyngbya sp. 15MV]
MLRFADHRQHLLSIISAVRAASAPFDLVASAHPPAMNLGVLSVAIKNLSLTRLEKVGADWRVAAVNEEPFTLPATAEP